MLEVIEDRMDRSLGRGLAMGVPAHAIANQRQLPKTSVLDARGVFIHLFGGLTPGIAQATQIEL